MADKRISFAPLEGITTYTFRQVFKRFFTGVDVFYSPFLGINHTHKFKKRDVNEYLPHQEDLIPQVLTNKVEDYIWGAGVLRDAGYREVNLNLGCPSGTVTSKGRGSGFLKDPDGLDHFLEEIFTAKEREDLPEISIKTRIGFYDVSEAETLAKLYSRYPFREVIVHPRLGKDNYKGIPNMEAFRSFYENIKDSNVTYNGDVFSVTDAKRIADSFPGINGIMLGRGLLRDPFLAARIKGEEIPPDQGRIIRDFIGALFDAYGEILSGEKDLLFKMKDILVFMLQAYPRDSKEVKAVKKARSREEIMAALSY